MIYLDQAATSFPKPEVVYQEMDRCLRQFAANPGRGMHTMALTTGEKVAQARGEIARFFNITKPERLVFTMNATMALNIALKGLLQPGDHVISTGMEHNAVARPLQALAAQGVNTTFLPGNLEGEFDFNLLEAALTKETKLIVTLHASNVTGTIFPIAEIGAWAREKGLYYLVDASQTAGSLPLDVVAAGIDLLAFPGHKSLMGPQGIGGLYISPRINLTSFIEGGTGSLSESLTQPTELPDAFESGTLNVPGIIGLGAAVGYLEQVGLAKLGVHKQELLTYLYEELPQLPQLRLYAPRDPKRNAGVVSLVFNGVTPNEVAYVLDQGYGIATRAGLHCAPLAHRTIGTTTTGTLRVSLGYFNTFAEIETLLTALREINNHL